MRFFVDESTEQEMHMNVKKLVLLSAILVFACSCPLVTPTPGQPDAAQVATALAATLTAAAPAPSSTSITTAPTSAPSAVPASPTACTATVVANTPANIRSGPGTVYDAIATLPQAGSAEVAGKNNEGTWWYILIPGGTNHGWIAASVVTPNCIPSSVAIVAAPPTPLPASGTCKDGYVYRLARSSDKICVPPDSKSQAQADNAAANSRKLVTVYGSDACQVGFVWREAFTGDHVCVTTAVRSQAAADNAAAASRVDPGGAYGPDSCVSGFVWREASPTDHVCVTVDVRTQAAADNAAASSRVAGADDCISGYVWRNAFSGDHVCVTAAVQSQVAADNAAAPSHTWP